jgi:spore coat protein U-like protein
MIKRFSMMFVGAACTAAAVSSPAQAGVPGKATCGVTPSAIPPAEIVYDPFSGTSSVTSVPLQLQLNPWTGNTDARKTQSVNFIFVRPASSSNIQVTYNGFSVIYPDNATEGRPKVDFQGEGEIHYNFGGQSAEVTFGNILITIPPNADISAGATIPLDIRYVCKGPGGLPDINTATTVSSGATLSIRVRNGLQASFVGSALDFGEVGDKTDAQSGTILPAAGNIRVASSGPYTVNVASENQFRMTYPGGDKTQDFQNLRYRLSFLNQSKNAGDATPLEVTCRRATVTGTNLPISATLLEGGKEEVPSAGYNDTLTVTFTPLVTFTSTTGSTCP